MSDEVLMKVKMEEDWDIVKVYFEADGRNYILMANYESWSSEELEDTDEHTFHLDNGETVVIDDMLFLPESRKLTKERGKNYWDYFKKKGFNVL